MLERKLGGDKHLWVQIKASPVEVPPLKFHSSTEKSDVVSISDVCRECMEGNWG